MTDRRGTLWAAILGSGIVFLDSSVLTVALPRIARDLPAHVVGTLEGESYLYNGYLLGESAFLILAGWLTDVHGRRRIFTLGLVAFGASSLLSGFAPSLEWLIVLRVLQGVSGALIVPGSLALVTASFSGEEQGSAFGVWSGASAGVAVLGPMLGGLLVDALSWRAVFLINVPLVLVALWLTRHYVREGQATAASGRLDLPGTVLTALALAGLSVGAISGQQRGWSNPSSFVALSIGGIATALLPWWMLRAPDPLVPPALFRSRNFTVTNLSTLVMYAALAVTFYYLTLFLQGTLGYSAAAAGTALIPGVLLLAVFSSRLGRLSARYGARWLLTIGPTVMALGVLWLSRIPSTSPAWDLHASAALTFIPPHGYATGVLPGLLVFGLGATLMVAPLTATVMASVPVARAGVASAVNTAISDVGPQLAVAVLFVAMTQNFYGALARDVPGLDVTSAAVRKEVAPLNVPGPGVAEETRRAARDASAGAFRLAMVVAAVMLLAGAVINAAGLRLAAGAPVVRVASADPLWRRCRHVAQERPPTCP
jgi:EmrB/QacA subfamily drug resistance transporter